MSDFCREDDACQFSVTIGDGPLDVVRLCKMVNRGCSVAISNEPFWYLDRNQHGLVFGLLKHVSMPLTQSQMFCSLLMVLVQ